MTPLRKYQKFLVLFYTFIFLSFNFLTNTVFADANNKNKSILLKKDITNEWLKNNTISDLISYSFSFSDRRLDVTDKHTQYYLLKEFENDYSLFVICYVIPGSYVIPEKTYCKLI
jgi:hypothetical protein